MGTIFDMPMGAQQLQEPSGADLLRRQARDAVDDLLAALEGMSDAPANGKSLLDPSPLACKQGRERGGGADAPFFQPSMPFAPGMGFFPLPFVGLWIGKKVCRSSHSVG